MPGSRHGTSPRLRFFASSDYSVWKRQGHAGAPVPGEDPSMQLESVCPQARNDRMIRLYPVLPFRCVSVQEAQ